jgi:phage terminase large subunit GpA-like protein
VDSESRYGLIDFKGRGILLALIFFEEIMGIEDIWLDKMRDFHDKLYQYKTVKAVPSEWVEKNIILTNEVSRFSGRFSYDLSPYAREIIDHLHPSNPSRVVTVMKGAQSGITQGVIVPGMAWIIDEHPDNFLFTASDKEIAKKTIVQRFDPLMRSSGLSHLIRPNVIRAKGQRSGDTDFSKEFAGGNAIIEGTNNAGKFRFFSVKTVFMDDFDNAPRADKTEGSIRKLVEGRQTSYGNLAKTYYVSTPTITQTSNVYEMYMQGDQRKWHWPCPDCGVYVPSEWQIKLEDGSYAGIVWELDEQDRLIKSSVAFRCPECGYRITNQEKHDLNILGKWIPTAEPEDDTIISYYMNSLIIPPGFINWVDLVKEWLKAVPPKGKINVDLLKVFNNVRLGLPFEEIGEIPKIMQLMENVRDYKLGYIPDVTSEKDGNGEIVLITLAADLGGIMNSEVEDVRIDWEIVAWSANGARYGINQGSCGTFKRNFKKNKKEKDDDFDRERYTYMHGMKNSVWPLLEEIIKGDIPSESGNTYNVKLSLVDTGHFTQQAYQFVKSCHSGANWVFGVKGVPEQNYRRDSKDVAAVKKSPNVANLYLLDVEQLKDKLAANMKLRLSDDGTQEDGFMNFPQPEKGKYSLKGYFKHFESETRKEKTENGESVGFKWEKKNSTVENHFWDISVYNDAARYVFIDLIKRTNPTKYKDLNWATLVELVLGFAK